LGRRLDDLKRIKYQAAVKEALVGRGKLDNGLVVVDTDPFNRLVHKLLNASDTIPLGRTRLWYCRQALRTPNRLSPSAVIITKLALNELEWWLEILSDVNLTGIPLASRFAFPAASSPELITTYSDASREIGSISGYGAWAFIHDKFYFFRGHWTAEELAKFSINVLEFLTQIMAIFSFSELARSLGDSANHVRAFVDNTSAENVSEYGRPGATAEGMQYLNRRLKEKLSDAKIFIETKRVTSKANIIADLLSRDALEEALRYPGDCGISCIEIQPAAEWRGMTELIPATWA
jgi:hypothetical protein